MSVSHLQARITTRLQQYRAKAELSRNTRPQAWVPREKLPRPLTSSASAIRKLMRKAELMGISTDIFPVDTSDANASMDGRRKHKQPALTADFVNYYLGEETHIQLAEASDCRNIFSNTCESELHDDNKISIHVFPGTIFQTQFSESAENLLPFNNYSCTTVGRDTSMSETKGTVLFRLVQNMSNTLEALSLQ